MGNAEPTREMPLPPLPTLPDAPPTEPPAEPAQTAPPLTMRDPLAEDAAKRAQAATALAKLGLSPAEVRRLLDADPNAAIGGAPLPAASASTAVSLPPAMLAAISAARLSAPTAPALAPKIASVPAIDWPEFRASSPAELREAEPLLREASLLRRREKYAEAETKCRAALTLVPNDAAALELMGDILQGVGRVDAALSAYQRAGLADPKRASAERKYADLLTRQQDFSQFDPEAATRSPMIATLLSSLMPGAGQFYNGNITKALFFFFCDVILGYLLFVSHQPPAKGHKSGAGSNLLLIAIVSGILYIASLADAMWTARKVMSDE